MRSVHCLAIACLIGSAMPAYCQTPVADDIVKLEVPRSQLQIIGQGLMELPYKTSAPVLSNLQGQLNVFDQAAAAAAKAKADAKPEDKPAQ